MLRLHSPVFGPGFLIRSPPSLPAPHSGPSSGPWIIAFGGSGLKITEITYGNWLTHGSQVENDVATACVHVALDAGITTFDTARV